MLSRQTGLRAAAALAAALVLVTGAIALSPATADTAMSPLELAQVQRANCQVLAAHATSSAQRTRAQQCINDQTAIIAALNPSGSPSASPSATQTPSPSPTPTVQPSPTVSPTATTPPATTPPATTPPAAGACIPVPSACGYPDATNTGAHDTLTVVQGNVTLSAAGQIYADRDVRGCINVTAANVTIRNVKVSCAGFTAINYEGGSTLTIEDSTVVCTGAMGNGGGRSIGDNNYIARRVNVSGCADGFNADHDVTIEDSYCHDQPSELTNGVDNGLHVDCIQGVQTANVTIRHNTLLAPFYSTSAIGGCCMPGVSVRSNWQILNNLMDGGAHTIYCFQAGTEVNSAVSGNRFGPGGWNHSYADDCNDGGLVWSGNVRDATGAALPAT